MKLEVHERLALLTIIPKEGDYAALKTLRRAKEMLSFTNEEMKFYNLRMENGATMWDTAKAQQQVKDCPIDEYTMNMFRNKLSEMNNNHKLTEEFMSVYEKIVVMYT